MPKKEAETKENNSRKENVLWLGLTSMFADVSSEMLNPILPLFLANILGAGGLIIGLVEGLAKASEHILSIFSGWFSDRMQRKKPLTVAGYLIATLMKATYAFAFTWPQLMLARIIERTGKAIRSPPRDALISESLTASQQRWGFSLHRILDTLGAIAGPFVTIAFLLFLGMNLQTLIQNKELLSSISREIFLLSLIPGMIGVMVVAFLVTETSKVKFEPRKRRENIASLLMDLFSVSKYGKRYRNFLVASLMLFLAIPAMAFLYLRASQTGFMIVDIFLLAALYNITYITGAAIVGRIKYRSRAVISASMLVLAVIFGSFVFAKGLLFIVPFAVFGFVIGMFEVAMREYTTEIVPKRILASAFGTYRTLTGLTILASGLMLGTLWDISPDYAFAVAGVLSLTSFLYFMKKRNMGEFFKTTK
ncbi:MAG: MFS transporter [Candidatus Micrarchaeia archaeon]